MIDIKITIISRHLFHLQLVKENFIKSHALSRFVASIALISHHLLIHNSLIKCKFQPYED